MKRVFVSLVGAVAAAALLALNMGAALAPAETFSGACQAICG